MKREKRRKKELFIGEGRKKRIYARQKSSRSLKTVAEE